ncbi:MAG: hypothetical protein K1000chlam2_01735 [Chlamydiae bacterium]|nr:hypothetical protein [Chlamydiota bacterium]
MNELYFVTQILFILLFSYGAFRLGKGALTTSVTVQALLANLFVLKQMTFFGLEVTCSDAFAIGSILSLNFLREYFGKESSKKAIQICCFFMIFFVAMSHMHLRFIPSSSDTAHLAYARLLTPAPRLLFASLGVFYLVQHLDIRLFGWISTLLPKSTFPMRSSISLVLSQFIDTVLFSFLGLWGLVAHVGHIIAISFLVKVCIILILGPFMAFFKRIQTDV